MRIYFASFISASMSTVSTTPYIKNKTIELWNYKGSTHAQTLISDRTWLYGRKCSLSFQKTHFSKFFFKQFRLPAISIPHTKKIRSTYGEDVGADNRSRARGKRVWYTACCCIQNSWPLVSV